LDTAPRSNFTDGGRKLEAIRDARRLVEACYELLASLELKGVRWGKQYDFSRPACTKYGPYQWLWDSGWHAIVWSHRYPENAIAELRTLLQFQRPDGFIPEIIFWGQNRLLGEITRFIMGFSNETFSDLSQMPMLAYSVRAIWQATHDKDLLREFVPKIAKFLEWWQSRDHDRDGLISIIHPWESGMDSSPTYDPVLRVSNPIPCKMYLHFWRLLRKYHRVRWNQTTILEKEWFNVEDVGVCSVWADGWGVLAALAEKFDSTLASRCRDQYRRSQARIIGKCWDRDRERFISLFHRDGVEFVSEAATVQTLLPILLDDLPPNILQKLVTDIKDAKKFWLPFPVPSVARSEYSFNPHESKLLWRGPMWPVSTWLIMEGLLKHGFTLEAEAILDRWIDLFCRNGIWEYYDPLTGQGLGQKDFGMSTIIVDMIARLERL
jgi:glycogen debranching enzyme